MAKNNANELSLEPLKKLDRSAWLLPKIPVKPNGLVKLGERLFFDVRLSGNNQLSCATCHDPALGWADGKDFSGGFEGEKLQRSTPTILNSVFQITQMWDGRVPNLVAQATLPIQSASEMNMPLESLPKKMMAIPEYRQRFQDVYIDGVINVARIAESLAAFEETIVSGDTPFDRWLAGQDDALSIDEKQGFMLFLRRDKGGCADCHQAPNFTDHGFHNIGIVDVSSDNADLGRFQHLPLRSMKGAFKTPGLRGINETAPYFHDGSAKNLKEVVEYYVTGGTFSGFLSPTMKTANLSADEVNKVVLFLKSLSER